jgi:hypothetical protein
VGDNMSDKKANLTNDILMMDLMLRLTSMERLLLEKGVFTKEELLKIVEDVATKASQTVIEKANSAKGVEDFISNLEKPTKDHSKNN